jgi:hypothetical protein
LEGLGVTQESDGNAEGGSLVSLGSARVENVSFTLDVFPDSLALDAALGNLVALYEVSYHYFVVVTYQPDLCFSSCFSASCLASSGNL